MSKPHTIVCGSDQALPDERRYARRATAQGALRFGDGRTPSWVVARGAQVVKSNVHSWVTCPQSHGTPSARAVGTVGFEASRQQRVRRPGR